MSSEKRRVLAFFIQSIIFVIGFYLISEVFPKVFRGEALGFDFTIKDIVRYGLMGCLYFLITFYVDKIFIKNKK